MLKLHKAVFVVILGLVSPTLTLAARAEALRFAWPDGASAKVRARSEGRRTGMGMEMSWDMSADFNMQVRRAGDRVIISRGDFSGWKGTVPPSFAGGAERFTDMIPTFIVAGDGTERERQVPQHYRYSIIDGTVLRPGESTEVTWMTGDRADPLIDKLWGAVPYMTFRACYCSVFDECWLSDMASLEAQPVKACPKPEHPYRAAPPAS